MTFPENATLIAVIAEAFVHNECENGWFRRALAFPTADMARKKYWEWVEEIVRWQTGRDFYSHSLGDSSARASWPNIRIASSKTRVACSSFTTGGTPRR